MFEAADIVLVRYPVTDLTSSKRRPAVILNSREYTDRFGDVVLMPLTGQPEPEGSLALREWSSAGLLKPSWIKPIIGTFSVRLIEKRLGKLAKSDERCVRFAIDLMLAAPWRS